jgi:hypothetical protein
MPVRTHDLWDLVLNHQWVDPIDLADALQEQAAQDDLDFRTRLLIRDGLDALRSYWGEERCRTWLASLPVRQRLEDIWSADLGRPGFPFLRGQLMDPTRPETVEQFLRDLGQRLVHRPLRINVGGSIALILKGLLSRHTQDLDVVDEVPQEIRSQHQALHELEQRHRLQLAHFQSHYLPSGWDQRVRYLDKFGDLTVYLVDPYDVFLSKLVSIRTKDLDDLRAIAPQLDKETLVRRLRDTMTSAFASAELRQRAEQNWYVLYGEALPT